MRCAKHQVKATPRQIKSSILAWIWSDIIVMSTHISCCKKLKIHGQSQITLESCYSCGCKTIVNKRKIVSRSKSTHISEITGTTAISCMGHNCIISPSMALCNVELTIPKGHVELACSFREGIGMALNQQAHKLEHTRAPQHRL